jgi:hypothetical protein
MRQQRIQLTWHGCRDEREDGDSCHRFDQHDYTPTVVSEREKRTFGREQTNDEEPQSVGVAHVGQHHPSTPTLHAYTGKVK